MRGYTYAKVSNEMISDFPFLQSYLKDRLKPRLRKGAKAINFTSIKAGLDGDDFIKNVTTFVVYFDVVKKPRFVK